MSQYIVKRLLGMIGVMFLIAVIAFLFVHMLPGDPAKMIAGLDASSQDIAAVRHQLGLDLPLLVQFQHFLVSLAHLDLGKSMINGDSVVSLISERYKVTATLALVSLWFIPVGILLGVIAAVYQSRLPDRVSMVVAVSGISVPDFWLGLILIQVFAVKLGWFNPTGYEGLHDLVLPSLTLGTVGTAIIARFSRSAFLDVLSENYIQTARAKGLMESRVLIKHAFRNAMLPIITVIGLQIGFVLSGSIVVESIFGLPALGSFLIDSVNARDYPVVQALLILYSFHFVLINFVVDVLYSVVNPQIKMK
ncbi:ABC transporter permease [Vibrio breoganii]|uniref:Glutathione transport system permease protein GsiC n=1 Tax=Vibrio breoganii TaxID=553239 RepID=A0AAJ3SDM3_9VIBR|nr:ABC transporter permease subunit [Vibrio breoganii]ANO33002.1 glutathione ABC transporter permease GsiC [Vibrio breoganii]MDN3714642.1 ABC transporter permease subunit [Vibrio breoganii]NMO72449.1 ABC transporter permease subunit [Vibrio breoganii]NMR68977.1 ABC transporter permease subunit [Vibrio breoganii]OCH72824.1 glutathione ABC transporter permease GsiC [Vibrio breoganii]